MATISDTTGVQYSGFCEVPLYVGRQWGFITDWGSRFHTLKGFKQIHAAISKKKNHWLLSTKCTILLSNILFEWSLPPKLVSIFSPQKYQQTMRNTQKNPKTNCTATLNPTRLLTVEAMQYSSVRFASKWHSEVAKWLLDIDCLLCRQYGEVTRPLLYCKKG